MPSSPPSHPAVDLSNLGLHPSLVEAAEADPNLRGVIEELVRRQAEEPYRVYTPQAKNPAAGAHGHPARCRLIVGGNRSGKTRWGVQEDIWHLMGDHPYRNVSAHSEGWVVGQAFPMMRDSVEPYFFKLLPPRNYRWYADDRIIEITRGAAKGNKVTFKSCDQSRERFAGAAVDWIHFDEEPEEDIYNECRMRLVDRRGSHWITFTPLNGLTWIYERLFLNKEQNASLKVFIFWSERNEHLPEGEIDQLLVGMSEEEQRARKYGEFLPLAGAPVLNRADVESQRPFCTDGKTGDLAWKAEEGGEVAFVERRVNRDRDSYLEVWKAPEPGHDYVLGSDHAEGRLSGDANVGRVKDRHTQQQVALLYSHTDAGTFADELHKLQVWYNEALFIPEDNAVGQVVIDRLRWKIARFYVRKSYDAVKNIWEDRYGFRTTEQSKRTAVELLRIALSRRHPGYIRSLRELTEMLHFIRDDKGRMRAQQGRHDDCVTAAWLCEVADNDAPPPDPIVAAPEGAHRDAWFWEQVERERKEAWEAWEEGRRLEATDDEVDSLP